MVLDARAIDEDIEPAEAIDDPADQSGALAAVGQVGVEIGRFAARGLDAAAEFFTIWAGRGDS
jgi:hypothetical protein